jgi:hypothetical protein
VVLRLSFIDVWKNTVERKTFTYYAPHGDVGLKRIHMSANLIRKKSGGSGGEKTAVAAFTGHLNVCTRDKPRRYGGRGLGKSTYNCWRMKNDAWAIEKCNDINPTVFHGWMNALRETPGLSLGAKGRNSVGLRFCMIYIIPI